MTRRQTRADKARARAEREAKLAHNQAVVATGKCPQCGSPLRRNLAILGWWQCSQYGAVGFRADPDRPACSFQTFTA
jgi:hypothetical protein